MIQIKRVLAMMLCLALLCGSVPGFSEAELEAVPGEMILEILQEEVPEEILPALEAAAEPTAEPTAEITAEPTAEPTVEPTAEPTAEPTVEITAEPSVEPTAEPTVEPTAEPAPSLAELPVVMASQPTEEPSAQPTQAPEVSADQLPEFRQGYAAVAAGSFAYDSAAPDAERIYYLESGVVYAADRKSSSDCDRIQICFDGGEGEIIAWADAGNLFPLSADAAAEFIAGAAAAFFHGDDPSLPLATIAYSSAITVPSDDEDALPPAMLVDQTSLTLGLWESRSLNVSFSDGQNYAVTYASDNPSIADVDAEGKITARYYGTTTIRLSSELGNEASVEVTVLLPPSAIWASAPKYLLGAGETVSITTALSYNSASALTFVSGNEAVATVDAEGSVHAVAPGSVYIGVHTYNNRYYWLRFIVYPAPQSIAWPQESITMGVDEERTIAPIMESGTLTTCSYASSNPEIVQVDPATGKIRAIATGEATVTVTTHNGLSDSLFITVKKAPTSVSFAGDNITLARGMAVDLPISFGSDEEGGGYTLTTGNWRVAYINGDNKLQGYGAGYVYIAVTTYNGKTDYILATVWNAPAWVVLDAQEKTLGVDEAFTLKATLPYYTHSPISFSSDNEAVATVDADGNVIAHSLGSATITAETFNGRKASCRVYVKGAPEYVKFEQDSLTLGVGQTTTLSPVLSPDSISKCTFSGGGDILQVNADTGVIKALATGETAVTVTTHNGKTAQLPVTVKAAPSCVSFAESNITLAYGQVIDLPEVILCAAGEDCAGSYTIATTNWRIATINNEGKLQGTGVGYVYIAVTTYNGKVGYLRATVWNAPAWVVLDASERTLGVDEAFTLKATLPYYTHSPISFSSDNEAVATVDADGNVIAHSLGSAVITAETYNGRKASCRVYVKGAPEYVKFEQDSLTLGVGQTTTLSPVLSPDSISKCTFSGGGDILQVNADTGVIKALATGETTVTVTTHNGKTAQLPVAVKAAPSCVSFAESNITLAYGQVIDLPEVILGAAGEDCAGSYTIATTNWRIATINNEGKLQGTGVGYVYIAVTTYNGKVGYLRATVWNAPAWVVLDASERTLGVDEAFTLKATLPYYTHSPISFSSDNETVATVDADGNVLAISPGSAVITAETYNGRKASCSITVKAAPESVALAEDTLLLGWGETRALSVVFPEGAGGGCTFEVQDSAIATVDAKGKVYGKALGETTVTVKTYNGREASCTVSVQSAPIAVLLQETSLVLSVGDTYQLATPTLLNEDAVCSTYTYGSTHPWVATVGSDGLITGLRPGAAYVTIATYNYKYDNVLVWVVTEPESIAFTEIPEPLLVDDVYTPVLKSSNNAVFNYSLQSSDEDVACITADGQGVLALSGGETTITATSYNGKTAEMTLRVLHLPDSVDLTPAAVTLGAGDNAQLTPVMPQGQGSHVRYTSSNPDVATADENGLLHAHSAGEAVITVHTKNEKTADCSVKVLKAPSRVTLSPRSAQRSLEEGGIQLSLSYGSSEEGGRITYSSSDEAIAQVNASGYVTFLSEGKVRITAASYNQRRGYCDLEIGKTPESMAFSQESYCVALGDSIILPVVFESGCESYNLSSSDADIVHAEGERITALQTGSVTLTARSLSGLTATCSLSVVSAPTGLTLNHESLELILNISEPATLTATAQPDGVGSAYFISSNPDVAAVDYYTGEIYPFGVGSCTITAVSFNGAHTADCSVTVRHLLQGVKIGIDPGHQLYPNLQKEAVSPFGGGTKYKVSAGTTGRWTRVREHVVTLAVGLKLRDALEALGAEVYMTRETADVNISNKERALMMNALGVDLVLRLHCNAADTSSAKGITIKVRKTGFEQYNCALAGYWVYNHMLWKTGAARRGLDYTDEFTGLNWSTVPSMLIEMGFMTNRTEDLLLVNPDYQQLLIEGMINGICAYKGVDLAYPYQ